MTTCYHWPSVLRVVFIRGEVRLLFLELFIIFCSFLTFQLKREHLLGVEWLPKGTEFKTFESTQYTRETIIIISNKTLPMIWRTLLSHGLNNPNQLKSDTSRNDPKCKWQKKRKEQCLTSLIIIKRQVKITVRYHVNQSEWPSSKSLKTEMLERGWRKENPSTLLVEITTWYNHYGASLLGQQ